MLFDDNGVAKRTANVLFLSSKLHVRKMKPVPTRYMDETSLGNMSLRSLGEYGTDDPTDVTRGSNFLASILASSVLGKPWILDSQRQAAEKLGFMD